jgi:hypothetical protein
LRLLTLVFSIYGNTKREDLDKLVAILKADQEKMSILKLLDAQIEHLIQHGRTDSLSLEKKLKDLGLMKLIENSQKVRKRRPCGSSEELRKRSRNDGDGHENFEHFSLPDSAVTFPTYHNHAIVPSVPVEMIDPEILTPTDSAPEACSLHAADSDASIDATDDTNSSPEPPSYTIDCILEKWKKDFFLTRWLDGSCLWVLRADILDENLLTDFEAGYLGYHKGVANVRVDKQYGRIRYRIYFEGRPTAEAV